MAQAVNAATRQDLLQAIRERYRGGLKDEKRRILDEFVAVTGYHRKHAIRLLMHAKPCAVGASRPGRLPVYDAAVREALIVLWEASDRICGKRLKPLLPMLVSALERHGHLTLESTVRARLLAASAATLDRLLRPTRAAVAGKRVRGRATPGRATEHPAAHVRGVGGAAPRRYGGGSRQPWGGVRGGELRAHADVDRRGVRLDGMRRARDGGAGAVADNHALPAAWVRHRQRRGVHERNGGGLLPCARDPVHAVSSVPQE